MNRTITGAVLSVLLSVTAQANERITREQIEAVIAATDAAALERDAAAIGIHLSEAFERLIRFPHKGLMASVRLDKERYMALIDEGWAGIGDYDYQRDDTRIHVTMDGRSGLSFSTVTENMVQDGVRMTSRFRETANYALENGRPVITHVSGHTLLGDTTPQ